MIKTTKLTMLTDQYIELIRITDKVTEAVEESGVQSGMVTIITRHTTTGIAVNESLECLEDDIKKFLEHLIPEDHPYAHARMLHSYGSTAGNATGHLKSHVTGNHCHFIIIDGEIVRGDAQDIYFCEFDGPAERTFYIQIQGERF